MKQTKTATKTLRKGRPMVTPLTRFGRRIRSLRVENGMSQTELSRKLKVSQPTLGMWEQGRYLPDYRTIARMEQLFGLDRGELLIPLAYSNDGVRRKEA